MTTTKRRATLFFALALTVSSLANSIVVARQESGPLVNAQREFQQKIQPILERSCGDCHGADDPDAGLDLSSYQDVSQILDDRSEWQKLLKRVAKNQMPPSDAEPMDENDRESLLTWVDQLINNLDCTDVFPGKATIRRLNRTEYQNTIRDLTLIDFQPAADFPGDDVGYGFDNIGDVLSLPPILMEKYLDAAETILDQAIDDTTKSELRVHWIGADFREVRGSRHVDEDHVMTTNGKLSKTLGFPKKGKYKITVEAYGDQAGPDWAMLGFSLNDGQKKQAEVEARRRRPSEHEFIFSVGRPGERNVQLSFLNDFYNPDNPLRSARDRNLYIGFVKIEGPIDQEVKYSKSHQKIITLTPSDDVSEKQAAIRVIYDFACRAYRRKITKEEASRVLTLFEEARKDGDTYEQALKYALQAILVSPHFLYKVENPPLPDGTPYPLSEFELATSLSYFLWSSMPDDELFAKAAGENLSKPEVYRREIKRLLADPKSISLVENFAEQWLQLRVLEELTPDPDLFPGCDEKLLADMATETRLLFADILQRDGSILELLNAEHSFLNQRLARHYGINDVRGDGFQKVSLKGKNRKGILTHASILTLTSNPNRTSPVKRGKWIMENLLGEEPPPALPDAAPLENQDELGGTLRERMEQHRKDPNCASCHQKMDQLGFALENFDAVGKWRDKDEGIKIDSSADLPDGLSFDGAIELQTILATKLQRQFLTCLTEKLLTYSLGRGLRYSDLCAVDEIIDKAAKKDYRISEFIIAVAESEPFRKRSIRREANE